MDEQALRDRLRAQNLDEATIEVARSIRLDGGDAASVANDAGGDTLPRFDIDVTRQPPQAAAGSDLVLNGTLAEGGMGRILLARQRSLRREVALKVLKQRGSIESAEALIREGAITGSLEHPGIVPVHALGRDERGSPVLVMKRIDGVGWDELLRDPGHPGWEGWGGSPEDRLAGHLQILAQVCNAVHFAHSRGVVHRDIKLENVLIGRFGDVYLADWGIAGRVGETESRICGTPGYLAPEMATGGTIDERTDVFLLGATLHAVLTGTTRHGNKHPLAALLAATVSAPHVYPESVPGDLAALANRCCARDPADRPPSALAVRGTLERYDKHRESRALGEAALTRLARAEALHQENDDATTPELERALTEAGFGLDQALVAWPENPRALEGRRRLDALSAERRARAALDRERARAHDPAVGAAARVRAVGAVVGIVSLCGIVILQVFPPLHGWTLLGGPAFALTVALVTSFASRNALRASRASATFAGMLILIFAVVLCGRVLGYVASEPVHVQLVRDLLVATTGSGVVALAYFPRLLWASTSFLLGALLIAVVPDHARMIYLCTAQAGALAMLAATWRRGS